MRSSMAVAMIELRRGWRSLLPIALLVVVVSAIVLWTVAAARRTDTAFDRMLDATEAFHVLVNPDSGSATELNTEDLLGIDGVADASRIEAIAAMAPDESSLEALEESPGVLFASDGGVGWRLARPIMVDGRFPEADRARELFLDVDLAALLDLEVGDILPRRIVTAVGAEQILELEEWAYSNGIEQAEFNAAVAEILDDPELTALVELEVTGIGRLADAVVVDSGFELPSGIVTPALYEQLGRPVFAFGGWHVRLDDLARVDEFRDAVDAVVPDETIVYQTIANVEDKAERSTRTPGGVMALFAFTVLVLGMLLVWQSVQRWLLARGPTMSTLRGIGAGRSQLWATAIIQVAIATVAGFVVGAGLAVTASPLAPVGPARLVEVDRGLDADAVVLGWGIVFVILLVASAAIPAWRDAGRLGDRDDAASRSAVSRWADSIGLPLPVATGVRFALDPLPGRRGSSRLAIVGALTGVVVAVTAIVFTASIEKVTSTPRLYGTGWSAFVNFAGPQPDPAEGAVLLDDVLAALAADPAVVRASVIHAGEVQVNKRRMSVVAYQDSAFGVERTVAEGRAPGAPGEIALGRTTLELLGVSIGDVVNIGQSDREFEATVVGQVVLPAVGRYSGADKTAMGEGALVDPSLLEPVRSFVAVAVDLDPAADVAQLEARLDEQYPELDPAVQPYGAPAEVESLRALADFPRWLAVALVVLVGIPVSHSLLVSIRGRRRDLAVMSALGARPATLRSIGLVQGVTVVAVGTIVGVPLGVVLGRVSWSAVAESFGTIPEPVVPIVGIVLLAVAVLAVGALIGGAPMWRTNRRAILRSLRPE
jgi:hypothetical protein